MPELKVLGVEGVLWKALGGLVAGRQWSTRWWRHALTAVLQPQAAAATTLINTSRSAQGTGHSNDSATISWAGDQLSAPSCSGWAGGGVQNRADGSMSESALEVPTTSQQRQLQQQQQQLQWSAVSSSLLRPCVQGRFSHTAAGQPARPSAVHMALGQPWVMQLLLPEPLQRVAVDRVLWLHTHSRPESHTALSLHQPQMRPAGWSDTQDTLDDLLVQLFATSKPPGHFMSQLMAVSSGELVAAAGRAAHALQQAWLSGDGRLKDGPFSAWFSAEPARAPTALHVLTAVAHRLFRSGHSDAATQCLMEAATLALRQALPHAGRHSRALDSVVPPAAVASIAHSQGGAGWSDGQTASELRHSRLSAYNVMPASSLGSFGSESDFESSSGSSSSWSVGGAPRVADEPRASRGASSRFGPSVGSWSASAPTPAVAATVGGSGLLPMNVHVMSTLLWSLGKIVEGDRLFKGGHTIVQMAFLNQVSRWFDVLSQRYDEAYSQTGRTVSIPTSRPSSASRALSKDMATRYTAFLEQQKRQQQQHLERSAAVDGGAVEVARSAAKGFSEEYPREAAAIASIQLNGPALTMLCSGARMWGVQDARFWDVVGHWTLKVLKQLGPGPSADRLMIEVAMAFGNVGIRHHEFAREVETQAVLRAPHLIPLALSNLAWVLTKIGCNEQRVWAAIADAVLSKTENHAGYRMLEVNLLSYAFAEYFERTITERWTYHDRRHPKLFAFLERLALRDVDRYSLRVLATVAWTFTKVHYLSEPLLRAVSAKFLASPPSKWTPQQMSKVAQAFAISNVRDDALLAAFAREVVRRLPALKPTDEWSCPQQSPALIAWALAVSNPHDSKSLRLLLDYMRLFTSETWKQNRCIMLLQIHTAIDFSYGADRDPELSLANAEQALNARILELLSQREPYSSSSSRPSSSSRGAGWHDEEHKVAHGASPPGARRLGGAPGDGGEGSTLSHRSPRSAAARMFDDWLMGPGRVTKANAGTTPEHVRGDKKLPDVPAEVINAVFAEAAERGAGGRAERQPGWPSEVLQLLLAFQRTLSTGNLSSHLAFYVTTMLRILGEEHGFTDIIYEAAAIAEASHGISSALQPDIHVKVHGVKTAIEVDGPWHYMGKMERVTGDTELRNRALERLGGFNVITIAVEELQAIPQDADRIEFLRRQIDPSIGPDAPRVGEQVVALFPPNLLKRASAGRELLGY